MQIQGGSGQWQSQLSRAALARRTARACFTASPGDSPTFAHIAWRWAQGVIQEPQGAEPRTVMGPQAGRTPDRLGALGGERQRNRRHRRTTQGIPARRRAARTGSGGDASEILRGIGHREQRPTWPSGAFAVSAAAKTTPDNSSSVLRRRGGNAGGSWRCGDEHGGKPMTRYQMRSTAWRCRSAVPTEACASGARRT